MSDVLVYNNWDPLEEIWLGDVYPAYFYDDLKPEIRDSFYKVTEWTKEDLNAVQKKFEEFGVIVRRPEFKSKEHYYDEKFKRLIKPPICPRDENAVIGNTLYYTDWYGGVFSDLAKLYNPQNIKSQNSFLVSGANIVKLGRDIVFDVDLKIFNYDNDLHDKLKFIQRISNKKQQMLELMFFNFYRFNSILPNIEKDYRIHYSMSGGHVDSAFMPVRPGLFLATEYYKDYDIIFPDWEKIFIWEPTYLKEVRSRSDNFNPSPYKWSLEQLEYKKVFNGYIEKYCRDWVGNYKETYFEVNIVMVDEKNMICIDTAGIHEPLFEKLNKLGINIHVVPWRTRSFWDGGIHCITLDIRRKTSKQDHFPHRGNNGLYSIIGKQFDNDKDLFYNQYNEWLKKQ